MLYREILLYMYCTFIISFLIIFIEVFYPFRSNGYLRNRCRLLNRIIEYLQVVLSIDNYVGSDHWVDTSPNFSYQGGSHPKCP